MCKQEQESIKWITIEDTVTMDVLIIRLLFVSDSSSFSIHFSTCNKKSIGNFKLVKRRKDEKKKKIKTFGDYIWVKIGKDHSNDPYISIKPRSKMPFM